MSTDAGCHTTLESRLRDLLSRQGGLSTHEQIPALQRLAREAAAANVAPVAAEALAQLSLYLALDGRAEEAQKCVNEGSAWAALATDRADLRVMVDVFRIKMLLGAGKLAAASRQTAATLADPELHAADTNTLRLLYSATAVLFELADQMEQASQMHHRAAALAAKSGNQNWIVVAACASAMLAVPTLVRREALFSAYARPLVVSDKGYAMLARQAVEGLLTMEAHIDLVEQIYGSAVVDCLPALRRLMLLLSFTLPRSTAAVRLGATAAPGLTHHQYAKRYLTAMADVLERKPKLALTQLNLAQAVGSAPDQLLTGMQYLASRAYLQLGQLDKALNHYEAHVALSAKVAARWDNARELTRASALADTQPSAVLGADWPEALRSAVSRCQARQALGVDVTDLMAWTGRSGRWLRSAFQKHLGMSPKEWLQRQKLDSARRQLQAGRVPVGGLSAAAAQWGFSNLSRFRASYRQAFGEWPQDTLRQVLRGENP